MEKKIVGWYVLDEDRPEKISDLEWCRDRLITQEAVDMLGGFDPSWESKMVPVFIEDEKSGEVGACILTEADILAGRDEDCTIHDHETV